MAKPQYKRESGVTDQQQAAITLLLSGQSQVATATELGVDVGTVNRWANHDPHFIATLNQRRQDLYNSQIERLRNLVEKAISVLESGLDSDDERVAISAARSVLKSFTYPSYNFSFITHRQYNSFHI